MSAILKRLIPAAVKQTAASVISFSTSCYSSEDESGAGDGSLMRLVLDILSNASLDTDTITMAAR